MAAPKNWPKRLTDLRDATAVLYQRQGRKDALPAATKAWMKFRKGMGLKPE